MDLEILLLLYLIVILFILIYWVIPKLDRIESRVNGAMLLDIQYGTTTPISNTREEKVKKEIKRKVTKQTQKSKPIQADKK